MSLWPRDTVFADRESGNNKELNARPVLPPLVMTLYLQNRDLRSARLPPRFTQDDSICGVHEILVTPRLGGPALHPVLFGGCASKPGFSFLPISFKRMCPVEQDPARGRGASTPLSMTKIKSNSTKYKSENLAGLPMAGCYPNSRALSRQIRCQSRTNLNVSCQQVHG
jgi:hypothetical protein